MKPVLRRRTHPYHRPRVATVLASRIHSTAHATRIAAPGSAIETAALVTIKFIANEETVNALAADRGSPVINEAPSLTSASHIREACQSRRTNIGNNLPRAGHLFRMAGERPYIHGLRGFDAGAALDGKKRGWSSGELDRCKNSAALGRWAKTFITPH